MQTLPNARVGPWSVCWRSVGENGHDRRSAHRRCLTEPGGATMTTDTISLLPLYPLQYEPLVHQALAEDLGLAGDLTTNAIIPPQARVAGRLVARRAGCIAGLE